MSDHRRPPVRHDIVPEPGDIFLPHHEQTQAEWSNYRIAVINDLRRLEDQLEKMRDRLNEVEVKVRTLESETESKRLTAIREAKSEIEDTISVLKNRVAVNENALAQRRGSLKTWSVLGGIAGAVITALIIWFITGGG